MRTLLAFFFLTGTLFGQPLDVFVNHSITYNGDEGFTISEAQQFDEFPGYEIDSEKAPCIAFTDFSFPHPNAQVLTAVLAITGTAANGSYQAVPINPNDTDWLNGDENFGWFDAWADGLVNSDAFLDLVDEGTFDLANSTTLTWVNGKYRGPVTSTDFILLANTPLVSNTFSNPLLTVEFGLQGDQTGDYELDVDDIDIMQVLIPAKFTSPQVDPYDWDGDGELKHSDVVAFTVYTGILPGDANGDGFVNVVDFNILAIWLFKPNTYWTRGDFNSDGVTDGSDFNIWNDNRTDI